MPSYYEAFGCVYTEAYACGVPFIGVAGQGIEELILPENRPFQLIKQSQQKELAEKIIFFYKNRSFNPILKQDIEINFLVKEFLNTIMQR